MPTHQSTAPASSTSRRTFLAGALVGGGLVTTGALVATGSPALARPARPARPARLAQDARLIDADYVGWVAPLELAAVLVYQSAIDDGGITGEWSTRIAELQAGHQTVADHLATFLGPDATAPVADQTFADARIQLIESASSPEQVLGLLGDLEDTLAATQLDAIGSLKDPVTARSASQILGAESQAGAALGVAGGTSVADATPAVIDTTGAVPEDGSDSSSTTTTEAQG